MDPTTPEHGITHPFQRRSGGVRFYVCCCPLTLILAPFVVAARLAHYGLLRLAGRPATWPWAV